MGNCQAIDAAALVIQYPSGTIERLSCPISASDVMNLNPGHYVSQIIPLPEPTSDERRIAKPVRFTRAKLLRPNETLALAHTYRLIPTQEVLKVLKTNKYANMKQRSSQKNLDEKSSKIVVAEEDEQHTYIELKRSDIEMKLELKNIRKHNPRWGLKS